MKRIPATTENIHCWDDIPLVKLGKVIRGMIWFTGQYILEHDEKYYEQYTTTPKSAQLEMQYRKQEIIILCNWEIKESSPYSEQVDSERFAIGIEEPHHPDFQITRYFVVDQIKFKHTKFYSVAIDKIEDALYNAQEVIDEKIIEEENEKKREVELEIIRKDLCKNLDVSIMKSTYGDSYKYREDKEYCLSFESIDNIGKFFVIEEVGGQYTQDEIKKIINIIGGNPRAIVERLTKK